MGSELNNTLTLTNLQCVQGWKGLGGYSVTVPLGVLLISETMLFMMDGCTRTRRQTPNAVDHRYLQIPTLDSMLSSASTGFKLAFSCVPTFSLEELSCCS